MKDMEFQYWPVTKPIPANWKLAHDLADTHHGAYSVLIVRVK